jgi:hypothetical protein
MICARKPRIFQSHSRADKAPANRCGRGRSTMLETKLFPDRNPERDIAVETDLEFGFIRGAGLED